MRGAMMRKHQRQDQVKACPAWWNMAYGSDKEDESRRGERDSERLGARGRAGGDKEREG